MLLENILAISIIFISYGLWVILNLIFGYSFYRKRVKEIGINVDSPNQPMHFRINKVKDDRREDLKTMLKANTVCSFIPVLNILVFFARGYKAKIRN